MTMLCCFSKLVQLVIIKEAHRPIFATLTLCVPLTRRTSEGYLTTAKILFRECILDNMNCYENYILQYFQLSPSYSCPLSFYSSSPPPLCTTQRTINILRRLNLIGWLELASSYWLVPSLPSANIA